MASQTPEFISQFIEDQFPEFFREQNKGLVEFVLAYFEYLEQENKTTKVSRQLLEQHKEFMNSLDEWTSTSDDGQDDFGRRIEANKNKTLH